MDLEHLPLLDVQRDLYRLPRGMGRFQRYIEVMTGGSGAGRIPAGSSAPSAAVSGDLALPLVGMNPMGKEHILPLLDQYVAQDAEGACAAAVDEARRRLAAVPGRLRVGLVLADDLKGGWTDRDLTEDKHRFERSAEVKRGFATVLLWTSEPADARVVRGRVLASVHRSAQRLRHGDPRTLGERMRQEGLALRFAGAAPSPVADDARALLARHRDSAHYPTVFACLYGDAAAERTGYPPLSVPRGAALALAVEETTDDPVRALAR